MDCTSCSTQLPPPPPPLSNVPPLLCPPPPPLSSTPPPPLYSTPPPPRRRTRRSSKGRWFKSGVATGSAVSLSSVTFVGFFIVIIRHYFQRREGKKTTDSRTKKSEIIKVPPLELSIRISVPDKTVPPPPPSPPPPPPPCCDSCASDWTPQRRPCYDSYVSGSWTQPYCVIEVTEPVNVESYIDLAEYMWSKLCY